MDNQPWYQLNRVDVFEYLAGLDDGSVDCIFTDPPYESLEKHRARGTTPRCVDWFDVIENDQFGPLLIEFARVLRASCHCYVMCDEETLFVLQPAALAAGFDWKRAIVWDKLTIGMGYNYRVCHEFVGFMKNKGRNRPLRDSTSIRSIQPYKSMKGKGLYPTQKPVGLVRNFLEQSVTRGETVLDPFMGSGVVGIAAMELGANFIGCDSGQRSFDTAGLNLDGSGNRVETLPRDTRKRRTPVAAAGR